MFFTAALRDATHGSTKEWKVIAWHKRVPTAVFRLLSPRYSATHPANRDAVRTDEDGKTHFTPPSRAYFVRTRQQALKNVVAHKDARATKWQIDTTPIGTCLIPPEPGEATDGMPGFQMYDATNLHGDAQLLEGMKNGDLPIRFVRAGTPLPIGYVLVEQSFEGKPTSDYHFRPNVPVTPDSYNSALRTWMKIYSKPISYEQLRKYFPFKGSSR